MKREHGFAPTPPASIAVSAPNSADTSTRRWLSSSWRSRAPNSRAGCHPSSGTGAGSKYGPDLTHLASRRTIASGTLPNNVGNLAGWILDPQSIKPGAKMPPNQLDPAALQALLAYLGTLK